MTEGGRRWFIAGVAATALVGITRPARAHHGWSSYDADRVLNLAGTIRSCRYVNPHGELELATPDKTWHVVLAPPYRMQDRGLTEAMLRPGTTCSVVGYPSKVHADEMRAERITVAGKTVELR